MTVVKNNLAIIVLNWNGADDALECIDSLAQQTLVPTIIVVDNDSHDDSVARFRSYQAKHLRSVSSSLRISATSASLVVLTQACAMHRSSNFALLAYLTPTQLLTHTGAKP